jgi:hypothetical protein
MAGADRSEAQREREKARRRRRESQAAGPEQPTDTSDAPEDDEHTGLKQAAKVAAAGAAVGAAVGAALAARDGQDGDDEQGGGDGEPPDPAAERDDAGAEEEQPAADTDAKPDEPEAGKAKAEDEPESEKQPAAAPEPDERRPSAQPRQQEEPAQGASRDETIEVVRRAREQLQALQGRDAESVSMLARTAEGWTVTLEVVELRRVPDSTDVLASYELLLDDDKKVIRFTRGRRYYRSQADRDGVA